VDRINPPHSAVIDLNNEIKDFYDQHPYPPPVRDLESYRQKWDSDARLRYEFHLLWPNADYREDIDILVAGCGTSQAAKHAIRQPAARVTGIDISTTSLANTRELKRKYQLENLDIQELSIERVAELGGQFDKIICTGVLHHLADPVRGLRALRSVLKPQGAMQLMVYAAYGRTGIHMLQSYARHLGIQATETEIKDLIAVLKELPRGHPLDYLLREAPDFRNPAALADALLNPRERAYTVPQVFQYLARSGMVFGRWYRQAPYLPQCGVLVGTPHAARLADLPTQEQYAAVELFRGTITSHSFTAYRDDSPQDQPLICFDRENWTAFVPIINPRLVCLEENLPAGAAAVLINQDHVNPDLIHLVNTSEKILFDAIDGQRRIGEIQEAALLTKGERIDLKTAWKFFARLWCYDHAVFDTSQSNAN
jgi:2-polyprenyl-3-methyl-5-hydroxy-6-metoxy-1,4-benzoquinol methylase